MDMESEEEERSQKTLEPFSNALSSLNVLRQAVHILTQMFLRTEVTPQE